MSIIFQIDSFVLDEQVEAVELSDDEDDDDDDLEDDEESDDDDEEEEEEEEEEDEEEENFLLDGVKLEDDLDQGAAAAGGGNISAAVGDIYPEVDPETQAKLEALFETAGIGKLDGETKQLTDPEVKILQQKIYYRKFVGKRPSKPLVDEAAAF
jgi:ABC-type Zn2+ transport system substrate-binding protein/surface adhesin